MKKSGFDRLLCVFCWMGTLLAAGLTAYMYHMYRAFPEVEGLGRNTLLMLLLLLVWLIAAVFFTRNVYRSKKN